MGDVTWKQGDTGPALVANLQREDGTAINLTAATVKFHMRGPGEDDWAFEGSASITDAATGEVTYTPTAITTAEMGTFEGEFEATLSGGMVVTCPNDGYFSIEITRQIK